MRIYPLLFTLWLIVSTVLLLLPGSSLPKETWLDAIFFDKWVHLGMFSVMTLLGSLSLNPLLDRKRLIRLSLLAGMLAFIYGLLMECAQHYWVSNRSFDPGDIVADGIGAGMGWVVYRYRCIKK